MKSFNLLLLTPLLFFLSCGKDAGPGGDGVIQGYCKHHSRIIPNDTVYIKYGSKDLPGVNPADYDTHVYADTNGFFKFTGLNKGNYYLYAFGYDTAIALSVVGGIPTKLESNTEIKNITIPVTEGD